MCVCMCGARTHACIPYVCVYVRSTYTCMYTIHMCVCVCICEAYTHACIPYVKHVKHMCVSKVFAQIDLHLKLEKIHQVDFMPCCDGARQHQLSDRASDALRNCCIVAHELIGKSYVEIEAADQVCSLLARAAEWSSIRHLNCSIDLQVRKCNGSDICRSVIWSSMVRNAKLIAH